MPPCRVRSRRLPPFGGSYWSPAAVASRRGGRISRNARTGRLSKGPRTSTTCLNKGANAGAKTQTSSACPCRARALGASPNQWLSPGAKRRMRRSTRSTTIWEAPVPPALTIERDQRPPEAGRHRDAPTTAPLGDRVGDSQAVGDPPARRAPSTNPGGRSHRRAGPALADNKKMTRSRLVV